jgi:hypothetical protein
MSQSIDFRINDFINEYLDYKGFNDTVNIFLKERKTRQEPIHPLTNGNHIHDNDQENYQIIKVFHFDLRIKKKFPDFVSGCNVKTSRRWKSRRIFSSLVRTYSIQYNR